MSLRRNTPSDWRTKGSDAEFLIISPRRWLGAVAPLALARELEGIRTEVVAVEDLYDEWTGGWESTEAIRQFVQTAARTGVSAPKYLLLVGDASDDPRQRLSGSLDNVLPTKLIESSQIVTASDAWFGDLDGDGTLEIAVGRLPFRSKIEVERYVARAIAYSHPTAAQRAIRARAMVVTDNDDRFPFGASGSRAAALLSHRFNVNEIDLNRASAATARAAIRSELASGVGVVSYFGHGGTGGWAGENILDSSLVALGGHRDAAPIVLSQSCLNGYFQQRLSPTLGETWLSATNGGAIAVVASTGFTNPYPQRQLGFAILEEMASSRGTRIGEILLSAQGSADRATRRTTVLLGDPTIPLGQ